MQQPEPEGGLADPGPRGDVVQAARLEAFEQIVEVAVAGEQQVVEVAAPAALEVPGLLLDRVGGGELEPAGEVAAEVLQGDRGLGGDLQRAVAVRLVDRLDRRAALARGCAGARRSRGRSRA